MKHFANNHRWDVSFKIGDWILVKLHPHRQTSTTRESYSKLARRFHGPLQVLQKIGMVAYKLQLPKGSHIHPSFNYSFLKPFHSSSSTSEPAVELPPTTIGNQPVIAPLAIINTRWHYTSSEPKPLVLVQWKGWPPENTTWEDWETLKDASPWRQGILWWRGNVRKEKANQPSTTEGANQRPKRRIIAAKYLVDFV